jgi:glycerophosphocholine phosphodiesterase GPCPD1
MFNLYQAFRFSSVRENTLHSLNHAAKNGADFVEFDVQLTKDRVPIIFHDFHVLIRVAKRISTNDSPPSKPPQSNKLDPSSALKSKPSASEPAQLASKLFQPDFHEIAVKDLRLQQLQLLHVS